MTTRVTEHSNDSFVETIVIGDVLTQTRTRHTKDNVTLSYRIEVVHHVDNTTEMSTYYTDGSSESILRDASLTVVRTVRVSSPSAFIGMITTTVLENDTRTVTETQRNKSYNTKVYDNATDEILRTIQGTSPSFVHGVVTETTEWENHKTVTLIQPDGSEQVKMYTDNVLVEEKEKSDGVEIVRNMITNETTKTEVTTTETIQTYYVNDEIQWTSKTRSEGDLTIQVMITVDKTVTTSRTAANEIVEVVEVQVPDTYTGRQMTIVNNFEHNYRIVTVKHTDGRQSVTKTDRGDSEVYQTINYDPPNDDGDVLIVEIDYQTGKRTNRTLYADGSEDMRVFRISDNELMETTYTSKVNTLNKMVTTTRHIKTTNVYEIKKTTNTSGELVLVEEGVYEALRQTTTNHETDRVYEIILSTLLVPVRITETSTDSVGSSVTVITEGDEQTKTVSNQDGSSFTEKRSSGELIETAQRFAPNINGHIIRIVTNISDTSYVTTKHDLDGILIQTAITSAPNAINGDRMRVVTQQDGSSFTMLIMRNGITKRLTAPIIQPVSTNIGYMSTLDNESLMYDQNSNVIKTKTIRYENDVRTVEEIDLRTNISITTSTMNDELVQQTIEYPSEEGPGFYFKEEHFPNGEINTTLHGANGTVVSYNPPRIDVMHVDIHAE